VPSGGLTVLTSARYSKQFIRHGSAFERRHQCRWKKQSPPFAHADCRSRVGNQTTLAPCRNWPLNRAGILSCARGLSSPNVPVRPFHATPWRAAFLNRSSAWLVGGFAASALLLGAIGLYGVIAYSVSRRAREIGVRMALGAPRGAVYRLILRQAGFVAAVGIVVGVAFSIPVARVLRGLLFGVQSWNVPTLIGVAVLLGICALLASYLPARRAASVNPVEALRGD